MAKRNPMSDALPPAQHLLTFAQTLDGGGVERAMLRLARGWIARGWRVTLLLGSGGGPLAAELPAGLEIVELGDARYPALVRAAPGVVRAVRPDVIFCPGNHYTSVAAWTRARLGRATPPIVGKVSNALRRRDMGFALAAAYAVWLRLHPCFLDRLVAMTPAMRDEAVAAMRMPIERTSVIANPPAAKLADAAGVPLPPGRFILGVGRLAAQKRWDRLIDALPRLADPTVRLAILGEGAERDALEAQAAALGVSERVALPGYAADPLPALARAAVVALTSDFEGVPGVLREAASVGVPVVTTNSSVAVGEMVRGDAGTIVPVGDDDALVAALDAWLSPGRARPAPRVTVDDSVGDYLALFNATLAARAIRPASWRLPRSPRDAPARP
jgi:glycosyltransferase involved in cell wall biosynthesis